jgi:hypothetical protein
MNKNRTNLYAPNATMQTAPMDRRVNLLPGPGTMILTKGEIRHLRKLVAKGKVARTCLPITAESNNRLFPYLGKLNEAEIEPIYHGHPFTLLAPSPVVPATIVETQAEVTKEVKKAKKPAAKKPPVVKAEVKKVETKEKPAVKKTTKEKPGKIAK